MQQELILHQGSNKKISMGVMFLTFLGFYFMLATFIFLGFGSTTRLLTVPVKGLILLLMIYEVVSNRIFLAYRSVFWNLFLVFVIIYFFRMLYDGFFSYSAPFMIRSGSEYVIFFISSVVVPIIYFGRVKTDEEVGRLFKILLVSGLGLMVLTTVLYRQLLTQEIARSGGAEEGVLGGLTLSYSSIIIIGIGLSGWLNGTIKTKYAIPLILISAPSFSLGASKGSIAALLVSIIFVVVCQSKGKTKAFFLGGTTLTAAGFYLIFTESAVIRRIVFAYNRLNSSAVRDPRTVLWEQSLINFYKFPILGDFIEVRHAPTMYEKSIYPHNFILESMISVGVVGTLPFVILIFLGFKMSYHILKMNHAANYWIALLFVQCLIHNMFSGALYNGIWFWSSLGLVFGRYSYYVYHQKLGSTTNLSEAQLSS